MPYTLSEIEALVREIEVAEESALSELAAFGYIELEGDERERLLDELF